VQEGSGDATSAADLALPRPPGLPPQFDRIVSGYVFHGFDTPSKLALIDRLMARIVPGGLLVIGDIAFATGGELARARTLWRERWDEEEWYWVRDELLPLLAARYGRVDYEQVSFCGGVVVLTR